MCELPGVDCTGAQISAWQETQAAAEQAYDRSSACSFTSFVAWEYSSAWFGQNLHRNVIFRNTDVMAEPISAVDTNHNEKLLWGGIKSGCLDLSAAEGSTSRCDVLTIPHNSNASNGLMWLDPASAEEAALRNALEYDLGTHRAIPFYRGGYAENTSSLYTKTPAAGSGRADWSTAFTGAVDSNVHSGICGGGAFVVVALQYGLCGSAGQAD
jgi:hypothetical protein